jgi:hypothetical protein
MYRISITGMRKPMKKLYVFLMVCLLLFDCGGDKKQENPGSVLPMPQEPVVVSVVSEPPGSKTAAYGTGIVVDKDNGLILTARHGVYRGDVLNYKNEDLFKNIIVTDKDHTKVLPGFVVHLSLNYDLAVIKVDHQFPAQAVFIPPDFLKIRDEIEFQGFPDGQYGVYKGNISNLTKNYLNLDMTIVEGMSGGPILLPNKGIVGIVLLRQMIGGNALRAEIILEYLSKVLPEAIKVRKKTYSLCLKKIRFNETKSQYNRENEPKLYFRLSVNGKKILETKAIEVSGSEMQWDDCANNKFKLTLLPGDRIELKVFEEAWSILKDSIFIEKVFEKLPQEGLPDLESEIVVDGNSFIFASVE